MAFDEPFLSTHCLTTIARYGETQVMAYLLDRVAGRADAVETKWLASHIPTCPRCQDNVAFLRENLEEILQLEDGTTTELLLHDLGLPPLDSPEGQVFFQRIARETVAGKTRGSCPALQPHLHDPRNGRQVLMAFLLGDPLPDGTNEWLQQHIAQCRQCRDDCDWIRSSEMFKVRSRHRSEQG